MTVALATSLYDATKAVVFSTRNADKTVHGDLVRAGVAAGQAKKACVAVSSFENALGRGAKACVDTLDAASKSSSVGGYIAKGVNFASKYVNPLLCVSGAVKVMAADDKPSEAIKQTCALGTMFAFEGISRSFLTDTGRTKFCKTALAKTAPMKSVLKAMRRLDAFCKVAGKSSKWVRFGIPIAKGIGFVCVSITGYSIGANLGDTINKNRKAQKSINYNPYNQQGFVSQPQVAKTKNGATVNFGAPASASKMVALTGVKPISQSEINTYLSGNNTSTSAGKTSLMA